MAILVNVPTNVQTQRERDRERAILAERKYRNYIVITFITCENNVIYRTLGLECGQWEYQ